MLRWYALHSLPRSEKIVAAALSQRHVNVYLPMLPPLRLHDKIAHPKPLFTRYLFCQCDLNALSFSILRWTPGLCRFVTSGDRPAIVPDKAIDLIRQRLGDIERQGGLPSHPFHPGDTVEIQSGPFKGLLAVFKGPLEPAERVRILLEFLGRDNEVEVSPDILEPVYNPPRRTRGRGRRIRQSGGGFQNRQRNLGAS